MPKLYSFFKHVNNNNIILLLFLLVSTWPVVTPFNSINKATTIRIRTSLSLSSSSKSSSLSSSSIGERLQQSKSVTELLNIANDLWLPTDPNLPLHLKNQKVHHEKRLRWSSQLLYKISTLIENNNNNNIMTTNDEKDQDFNSISLLFENDDRFIRAIQAATIPFQQDRPKKEARYIKDALIGLHDIIGTINPCPSNIHETIMSCIVTLVDRAEKVANDIPLNEAIEMRWSILGIYKRLGLIDNNDNNEMDRTKNNDDSNPIPKLQNRVSNLPFDIFTNGICWNEIYPNQDDDDFVMDKLYNEIPFKFETITTKSGAQVKERRGTAWIAQPGIGALAYSGKLMAPSPFPNSFERIVTAVQNTVLAKRFNNNNNGDDESISHPLFFDCALCNYYPDGESACKFHTDPEHGTHWDQLTCVVSAGAPRRFAFRPIPGSTTWEEWDNLNIDDKNCNERKSTTTTTTTKTDGDYNVVPAVFTLFPGDIVKMFASCNDQFHHAVYPNLSLSSSSRQQSANARRISLVFKHAIARNGGRRGHSLPGEGRKWRKRQILGETDSVTVTKRIDKIRDAKASTKRSRSYNDRKKHSINKK